MSDEVSCACPRCWPDLHEESCGDINCTGQCRTQEEIVSRTEECLPAYPVSEAKFELIESEDRRSAWVRSWPEGKVHYFPSHTSSNQATCGQFLTFWPEMNWPKGEFCPTCEEAILTALGEDAS